MSKPKIYAPPIPTTNASVQDGEGNAKNAGKFKARYPHPPLGPSQKNGEQGRLGMGAMTPGTTPAGS